MATVPSIGNISYSEEIHQHFFNNRKLIANIYENLGNTILSSCIAVSETEHTEELIKLTKKLINHLCIIDTPESVNLLFKLHANKLVLDTEIVLHLKKLDIKLKD